MDPGNIKLVIWDLDNTFWSGTISEGSVQSNPDHIKLVRSLTDCGIINSICSKNTFEIAADKLKELEVYDYFVFPSIDWTSKGQRIRNLIQDMSLRAENVLFIDDEITNVEEAKHYSPQIMVASPGDIHELIEFAAVSEKKDLQHKRLTQYKLLEKKGAEQKKYDKNDDFLYASNIKVDIVEDCISELERIHELISRSNQLNYTKKRVSKDELKQLLGSKDARCSYVSVNDKFGNYGIVGFYAILKGELEHFTFSCRVMGLGVEQYVYSKLNCPPLTVVGVVAVNVISAAAPLWINTGNAPENIAAETGNLTAGNAKFLFKSACDFSQTIAYIKNGNWFHCEFDYVNTARENVIEGHNHSVFIVGLKDFSAAVRKEMLDDCVFYDSEIFAGSIFSRKYDIVFLSTLPESYAGIYKKKNSDIKVSVGSYLFPLTDKRYWAGLIGGKYYSASNKFTVEYLKEFTEKYEFQGKTTPEDYCRRIGKILNDLDQNTKLCLILGVEFPCEKNTDPFYKDRHISHAQLNKAIREMAHNNPRLLLLDLNHTVKSQNDFTYNLNEFTSRVNYDLSKKVISIINESVDTKIESYSSLFVFFDEVLNAARKFAKNLIPRDSAIYDNFKLAYYKLSRKSK
ncbi:MAG TPA: HAD-IIIC family phosphatase [Paludibacter sp.]|nr:HAD-IIIC family phosphatase [Paludibacter sp.]